KKSRRSQDHDNIVVARQKFGYAFPSFHHKTLFLFAVFLYFEGFNELTFRFTDHRPGLRAKKNKYFILLLLAPLILGSCSGTKYLQPGEKLLKQRIEAPRGISRETLKELYVQRSNRKLFGIVPYFWFYYTGKKHYDAQAFVEKKARVEADFNRRIAEVPEENEEHTSELQSRENLVCRLL